MSTSRRSFFSSMAAAAATVTVNPAKLAVTTPTPAVSGQACYIAERLGWKLQSVHNNVACFASDDRDTFNQFVALDGKNDLASMVRRLKDHEEFGWQIKQRVSWAFDPDTYDVVRPEETVALAREVFGDAAVDRFLQIEAWQKAARDNGRYLSLSKGKYGEHRELSLYTAADMGEEEFCELCLRAEQPLDDEEASEEGDEEFEEALEEFLEELPNLRGCTAVACRCSFELTVQETLGPDFAFVLLRPHFTVKQAQLPVLQD